jgi:hypothetical protein
LKLHLIINFSDAKKTILSLFVPADNCSSCPFTSHFRNRNRLIKGGEQDGGLKEKIEKTQTGYVTAD